MHHLQGLPPEGVAVDEGGLVREAEAEDVAEEVACPLGGILKNLY